MRVLLVEDEKELAVWLSIALAQSGFTVEWAADGLMADNLLACEDFDAVVLDLGLPAKSGHGVLATLRAADNRVPVLVLTARDSVDERVSTLNKGADDFLAKPFALAELEARLMALVRRSRGREHSRLSCGPLLFDPNAKQFLLSDVPLALTPREYALLSALIVRGGEPISKVHLLDRVFPAGNDVGTDAIEVLIYRLRKKLGGGGVTIVTQRGFGYCLEADTDCREVR
ncbi:MAG: response regulator [Rubrivivax sp.]